jgi:hypothetical protein
MQPALDGSNVAPPWSPVRRALLRFALVYLVLVNFLPYPLPRVPFVGLIGDWYDRLWNALVPWAAARLFHLETRFTPTGSGDETFNYVQLLCCLVIAFIASAAWTLLDRERSRDARLAGVLRIYVRLVLAAAMIAYGGFKVIKSQFPDPSLDRLLQPYGDASPMGLLWTFMGASAAYTFFAGAAELIGGLLLTMRRTTLLGALISFAALSNVVALNFFYDVPVKLYSAHLLAMAALLIVPDLRRLIDVLVLGRRVEPIGYRPFFRRRWMHRGALILCTVLVAADAGYVLNVSWTSTQTNYRHDVKAPLHGIWSVDTIEVDGRQRPPLVTDRERWRRVIVDYPGTLAVQLMSDSRERYSLRLDQGVLTLGKRDDPNWKGTLTYAQPKPELLTLAGTLGGRRVRATLHREKPPELLLTTRGFHWINERPFNR